MVDSENPIRPGNGWLNAILPNPFAISAEQGAASADIPAPEALASPPQLKASPGVPNSLAMLHAYVPDFAGQLPRPVPTLGDYYEPTVSAETITETELLGPYVELGTANRASDPRKLRGIGLVGAVFDVLSKQLGTEYTTAELMLAAQQLIDISKAEYVGVLHKDAGPRASYYSWDLVRAFAFHPWQIAQVESQLMDHCDTDEFSPESFDNAKFIIQGWGERTWEF